MRARAGLLGACLVVVGFALSAEARPEKIQPGISYYSDDFVTAGLVRDIADEKNLEEVYQFYSYYEAIYDENERVVTFKEYIRGDVARVERYRYGSDGAIAERVVERPGKPAEVTTPAGSKGGEGDS